MKNKWKEPEITNLNIERTEYGGEPTNEFDHTWQDDKKAWYATFKTK